MAGGPPARARPRRRMMRRHDVRGVDYPDQEIYPDQEMSSPSIRSPWKSSNRLLLELRNALGHAGWSSEPPGNDGPWVLVARKASRRYPVILNQARVSRLSSLQGLLADAILRGRAAAGPGRSFLAVVGTPGISRAMAAAIEGYARKVAPGQPFGYVDERGLVRLFGPGLDGIQKVQLQGSGPGVRAEQPRDLFSDLNQWMLKVLVGGGDSGWDDRAAAGARAFGGGAVCEGEGLRACRLEALRGAQGCRVHGRRRAGGPDPRPPRSMAGRLAPTSTAVRRGLDHARARPRRATA